MNPIPVILPSPQSPQSPPRALSPLSPPTNSNASKSMLETPPSSQQTTKSSERGEQGRGEEGQGHLISYKSLSQEVDKIKGKLHMYRIMLCIVYRAIWTLHSILRLDSMACKGSRSTKDLV